VTSFKHYKFHSEWFVRASPDVVYAILEEVAHYPEWWPQVKRMTELDERRFEFVARSFLPYDIRSIANQSAKDPRKRVLEVSLEGDLTGFSRFTIHPQGLGTHIDYEQEVTLNKPLLNVLAPVAKGFFRANHGMMMRGGQRGLQKYAAGYSLAQQHGTEHH
jgi:Polyketide cyclase / dehydrase and lipid transport